MTKSDQPEDLPPIVNRRQAGRQRVLLGGLIVSRDGMQTWDCTIKDISIAGAKIRIVLGQIVPEHFTLVNLRDGTAYESTVQWLRLPEAGLKFSKSYRLQGNDDPKLQHLRRLWQERRVR